MIFQPSDNHGDKAEIYRATDSHNRDVGVERDTDPTLDRAVAALRGQEIPEGPPSRLVDDTLAAMYLAMPKAGAPSRGWFRFPARFLARAAIFLIVAGAVFAVLFVNLNSSSVAFADVIKKVRQSRSLAFTMHTSVPGMNQSMAMRFFAMEDGRLRMEMGDGTVMVVDSQKNKALLLVPKLKQALMLTNANGMMQQKGGADFAKAVESLKKLGDRPRGELGEKEFDGRRLRGFVATQDNVEFAVWADPRTGAPVRIEFEPLKVIAPETPAAGAMKMVMADFQVDPAIEESKFSLDIPKGYVRTDFELPKVAGGEESLLYVLRGYTRRTGEFPKSLTDWAGYANALKGDAVKAAVVGAVKPAPGAIAQASGEAMEYAANLGAIIPFLHELPKDAYAYLGRGKAVGDKDAVVFWYRRGDGSHRAIFGDLSVRDVGVGELPR